ncbi:MAG: class II fructose-bisphosphate aldolase [Anaerolineae bacterium]|nr:class II fructose-bisphosphate aldolase [Anaerolineae bacterium]
MALVPFNELMTAAEEGGYAVGYFESWNLESLLATADAAEAARSPVILGFSGLYLPHPRRQVHESLRVYAAMGLATCRHLTVPCCLLFNESPELDWVLESIDLGFNLVMFADERLGAEELVTTVAQVVEKAHARGIAVEGEMKPLPGLHGEPETNGFAMLDDPLTARAFVERTGVDALAVNVGQTHTHGRSQTRLDLERLAALRQAVPVPLVLHGATSIYSPDLVEAIRLGVRKINVGSILKRTYFETLRRASNQVGDAYNPYDIIGSGFPEDVLTQARVAVQERIIELMQLFGSAGKAA